MAQVMPKVAKCPCCDSELIPHSDADVEYSAEGATCLSHSVSWKCEDCSFACDEKYLSRISAAMELAEAKAWRQEVWEATRKPWDFVQVLRERKSIESIYDIFDKSEEDVKSAEKRVLEVFTQKQP